MRRILILAVVAWLVSTGIAYSDVTYDAVSSFGIGSGMSSGSGNHVCTCGTNGLLVVFLTSNNPAMGVSSITYAGAALTLLGRDDKSAPLAVYYKKAPATGTNSLAVTLTDVYNVSVGAISFSNVDQTTPFGTHIWGSETAGNQTVTITVPANGMGVTAIAYSRSECPSDASANSGNGHTQRYHINTPGGNYSSGVGATTTTTGSIALSYTICGDSYSNEVGIPLNVAAAIVVPRLTLMGVGN